MIRVLVGDGFSPFRTLFISKINEMEGVRIIGEVSDGLEAVREASDLRPDVVLLDLGLPKLNGIEAARFIRQNVPDCKILIVSLESSPALVDAAFAAGASGYLVKSNVGRELMSAVMQVLNGGPFISSSAAHSVYGPNIRATAPRTDRMERGCYHDVVICDNDASLVKSYAGFIKAALMSGKAAVFIGNELHRAGVALGIRDDGMNLRGALEAGRYTAIDAAASLATIMEGDIPSPIHLTNLMTEIVERLARTTNNGVVACGEIAPTLLAQGRLDAAIQVEHLFDNISRRLQIGSLCGYLTSAFQSAEGRSIEEKVCSQHSSVHRA